MDYDPNKTYPALVPLGGGHNIREVSGAALNASAKTEAITNADAHLNNAGLPTYTEMLAALRVSRMAMENAAHHIDPEHGCCGEMTRDLNAAVAVVSGLLAKEQS